MTKHTDPAARFGPVVLDSAFPGAPALRASCEFGGFRFHVLLRRETLSPITVNVVHKAPVEGKRGRASSLKADRGVAKEIAAYLVAAAPGLLPQLTVKEEIDRAAEAIKSKAIARATLTIEWSTRMLDLLKRLITVNLNDRSELLAIVHDASVLVSAVEGVAS